MRQRQALTRTILFAAISVASIAMTGCGAVGFEIAEDEESKAEKERIYLTPPPTPLLVGTAGEVELNQLAGNNASGITAVFDFVSDKDQDVIVSIKNFSSSGCKNEDSNKVTFTWRELASDGATIAETEALPTEKFSAHAATYALVVELKTSVGRCKSLALNFEATSIAK